MSNFKSAINRQMAGKGGRTSTTWKKGENPTRKPGQKSKSTLLKESVGLNNWEKFQSFIQNEGADKLTEEMSKLNGKDFINAYSALAEFVKPKLNRTTIVGDPTAPVPVMFVLDERFKDTPSENS